MKNSYNNEVTNQFVLIPLNCLSLNFRYNFLVDCFLSYAVIQKVNYDSEYKGKISNIKYNLIKEWESHISKLYKDIRGQMPHSLYTIFLKYKIIEKHKNNFQNIHKKNDALVLLYLELLNDILHKNVLSERQFRILCAIYSVIGKGKPKPIYNNTIRFRSFGYMTELAYKDAESNTKQERRLYSNKILSKEINFLRKGKISRNFFQRCYDGRKYYYSRIHSRKYLENFVINNKLQHKFRREEESLQYEKFSEKIKRLSKKKLNENELDKHFINSELPRRKYNPTHLSATDLDRGKKLLKSAVEAKDKRKRENNENNI